MTDEQIKALTDENAALKTQNEGLKADVSQLKKQNTDLKVEQAQASAIIDELKAELASSDAAGDALPQLKIGSKTYELTSDFSWLGQIITAQVLKENAKLAQSLIKEGVSHLREVL